MDYYYYMALTQSHKVKLCSVNTHSQPQNQTLAHGEGMECRTWPPPWIVWPLCSRSSGPTLPYLLPPSIPSCATTWVRQGSGHNENLIQENETWMSTLLWLEGTGSWTVGTAFLCFFFSQYSTIKFIFLSIYYAQVTGGEGEKVQREQRQPWSLLSMERLPE